MIKNLEKLQFITTDNIKYNLHNPPRKAVIAETGFGMPPVNMYTTTGAYQHGTSPVAYTLEPRDLTVTIRHSTNSRSEYWNKRDQLIDQFSIARSYPNAPTPGKLRKIYFINGIRYVRDIDCFFMGGLDFNTPAQNTWDAWGIDETLQFKAYNPIFYNPTPHVVNMVFGNNVINYVGTWESYPSIDLDGVMINWGVKNVETDIQIVIAGFDVGDSLSIDLTYGQKLVTNNTTGGSMISEVSLSSNLSNFSIQPDPLVTNGVNTILMAADAGNPTVVMTYYDRYIGI